MELTGQATKLSQFPAYGDWVPSLFFRMALVVLAVGRRNRGYEGDLWRALWPGLSWLVPAVHVVRRTNVRERGKGESFVPAKFCCGPRHVGPVFEALPAWIAGLVPGLVPAMTTKDGDQRQTL